MPVGDIKKALLWIVGKGDVPDRSLTQCSLRYELFFDEFPVLLEHLNTIVLPVADINQPIPGNSDAAHGAKLFRRRSIRIVGAEFRVSGTLPYAPQ